MPEKSSHLAEYLFNPTTEQSAINNALQAVEKLRLNPDNLEVEAELNCALDKVIAAVEANIWGPSPRLTDMENDQFLVLKRKKLVERHSGNHEWYDRIKLNDEEEMLYEYLEAKIDGRVVG
mgnify:CR=1 FL=1